MMGFNEQGGRRCEEECGMGEFQKEETITEYPMVSFSGLQMESAVNNSNDLEDDSKKNITLDEAHQSETSNILSDSGKIVIEVKRDDDVTINTDESSTNMIMPVDEPARGVEETISHDPANPSAKVWIPMHEVAFFCPWKGQHIEWLIMKAQLMQ